MSKQITLVFYTLSIEDIVVKKIFISLAKYCLKYCIVVKQMSDEHVYKETDNCHNLVRSHVHLCVQCPDTL